MAVTFGLLSSSGILVHFTGGLIESHFHYFVMVTVVALYQDWKPLLLGVGYVAVQHATVGVVAPESVYNHFAAFQRPVLWAVIHATYILFLVVVQLSHWRLAEKSAAERNASEERFRRSFEAAPIGMALMDMDGRFLQVNRAMGTMLGYSKEQLLGSGLMSLTHSDDHPDLTTSWAALKAGESTSAKLELRCLRLDGRTMWGRLSLSALPEQSGLPPVAIVQIEDATRAHEDRERLQQLVGGKDEYIASIGQEIRSPLAAVLELADDLDDRDPDLSAQDSREAIRTIASRTREVARIVEDLLVSARAGTTPVAVVPRMLQVERLCHEAAAEIPGGNRVEIEPSDVEVWADPGRTRQILAGLIGNAVRYGGPTIKVTAASRGADALVQVWDDGPEIPGAEQERIFHADLRAGAPLTQPTSVGLGLSVARYLARLMGGDVRYRRAEAMSVFELRLPREPSADAAQPLHPRFAQETVTAGT
jgi:PAS domain S-box-containing protein